MPKAPNYSDSLEVFGVLKRTADEMREWGWDVHITVQNGEVDSVALTATKNLKEIKREPQDEAGGAEGGSGQAG